MKEWKMTNRQLGEEARDRCFLVYSGRFDDDEVEKVRRVVHEHNYRLVDWKADLQSETHRPQIEKIWLEISRSRRVIAILDYQNDHFNANVLYEYGFAHGYANSQKLAPLQVIGFVDREHLRELPFDIQSFVHIPFDGATIDKGALAQLGNFLGHQDEEILKRDRDELISILSQLETVPDHLRSLVENFLKRARHAVRLGEDDWVRRTTRFKTMIASLADLHRRLQHPDLRVRSGVVRDVSRDLNVSFDRMKTALNAVNPEVQNAAATARVDTCIDNISPLSQGYSKALRSQHDSLESPWNSAGVVVISAAFGAAIWATGTELFLGHFEIYARFYFPKNLVILGSLMLVAGCVGFARPLRKVPRVLLVGVGVLVAASILNGGDLQNLSLLLQESESPAEGSLDTIKNWLNENGESVLRRSASVALVALMMFLVRPAQSARTPNALAFGSRWIAYLLLIFGLHYGLETVLPSAEAFPSESEAARASETEFLGFVEGEDGKMDREATNDRVRLIGVSIRAALTSLLIICIAFVLKAPWRFWKLSKYRRALEDNALGTRTR
jgi:hypothetical protein